MTNNNQQAFLELVRAGLWEKEARLLPYGEVNYAEIMRLAQEQAVVGLVAAGIEHVVDIKLPQADVLQFVGQTLQLEQRNVVLNAFIARLIDDLRQADIYTILVKGQGIAQCYERPMWRVSGDVDLLLSKDNFEKAKKLLLPLSTGSKPECNYSKELGFNIDSWSVELHGTQRTGLSTRLDKEIDAVQNDLFYGSNVRSWQNGNITVYLPSPENDVFIVFTHFIKHFYKEGGVSIRQLCDCCRLLWRYKDSLNFGLLESRLKRAGLKTEWRAFAAVAVDYLGMPVEAMPLYSDGGGWSRKANNIVGFVLKGGEWRKWKDTMIVGRIFPASTLLFAPGILLNANWLKVTESLSKK